MSKENSLTRREFARFIGFTAGSAVLAACMPAGKGQEITPDPGAVAERVKQLKSEAILNTPETGLYNPEQLQRWLELEPPRNIQQAARKLEYIQFSPVLLPVLKEPPSKLPLLTKFALTCFKKLIL